MPAIPATAGNPRKKNFGPEWTTQEKTQDLYAKKKKKKKTTMQKGLGAWLK
jgi:hypothetical protein